MEISVGDYLRGVGVNGFDEKWVAMGQLVVETYQLTISKTIEGLIPLLKEILNLAVVDKSDFVTGKGTTHTMKMSGIGYGGIKILVVIRMVIEMGVGVNVEISVKSDVQEISQLVADSLG